MPTARYSNYELIIELENCNIDLDVFRATPEDFLAQLRERRRIPDGLRVLIAKLFQQRVITGCVITYGKTMTLRLSPICPSGHDLLLDGALEKFKEVYTSITKQPITVGWESSSKKRFLSRRSRRDCSGILGGIVQIVDLAADAVVAAAALKELFGDSE